MVIALKVMKEQGLSVGKTCWVDAGLIMGVFVCNIPCHTNTRGAGLYEVAGRARTKEH